ncbi:hypothetical protein H8356DRAFT_1001136 [Neocallimastix lanati (nom. inval.)]|nr:hypothetical protein H8356DRAFT_1001136 [Neocallimastix sp. JGI-2020a]
MDYTNEVQMRKKSKKKSFISRTTLWFLAYLVIISMIPGIITFLIRSGKYPLRFRPHTYRDNVESNPVYSYILSFVLLIIFISVLFIFWKKRDHYLINYRPVILCMLTGSCAAVYSILLPIIILYTEKATNNKNNSNNNICMIPLIFTIIFAPMSMMANLSRYMKIFLLNRRDVGRLKLFNEHNRILNSSNGSEGSSINSNFEPNIYVKRLNKLVSKQITIGLFVVPYLFLIVLGIIMVYYVFNKEKNCPVGSDKSECGVCNQGIILYSPIIILAFITSIIIPFIFIKMYTTLNFVNKCDFIINFVGLLAGGLLFTSSLFVILDKDKPNYMGYGANGEGEIVKYYLFSRLKNSSLFFIIPSFCSFFCANCIPLIEVFLSQKQIKQKKLLGKKEFTKKLMDSRYIESLKTVAVKSYCVELIIFWDTHMKVLKRVYNEIYKDKSESSDTSTTTGSDGPSSPSSPQDPMNHNDLGLVENNRMFANGINTATRRRSGPGSVDGNMARSSYYNTPSVPSNFDLLLGLNKNIFGKDNERIIYTGCFSNSGLNPNLINYVIQEKDMKADENQKFSPGSPSSSHAKSQQQNYYHHNHTQNSNDYGSHRSRNDSNFSLGSFSSQTALPYNNNNNNSSSNSNNNNNKNNFTDGANINQLSSSNNSDKAGLLYHSETNDYRGIDFTSGNGMLPYGGGSGGGHNHHDHGYGSTNRNSLMSSSRGGLMDYQTGTIKHKNPNFNKNTELFYEIFNIDPDHVVLPPKFWSSYTRIYHSFISEKSLATVNIDDSTIVKLSRAIRIKNYTMDMFFPAIAETVDLMYQNLYPKLVK